MGFHVCEYCQLSHTPITKEPPGCRYHNTSSGDVTLVFSSGRSYEMPDMILHYIADHHWLPPSDFVDDVVNSEVVDGHRMQTKGLGAQLMRIAYLSGPFEEGDVPDGFVEKLEELMKRAADMGQRVQYRDM